MANFLTRLLSIGADKQIKEYRRTVERVNALEPRYQAMTDEELRACTDDFRARYAAGETLDDLLPEAFAVVREASVRTTGLRHFDVQLIGAMALNAGSIAEMKTGEGKTLVSTLAGYLNAIPGKGVHIVTVNDYLAKRDSEWMGQIYRFLGMKVGLLQNGMKLPLKVPAYQADVTYGTNTEFGFDYLRDNMVRRPSMRVQRGHNFAIVDEVDSILIDEARTPLIISGAGSKSATIYKDFARAVRGLIEGVDFEMDEAKHTIATTDEGLEKVERFLDIDDLYADPTGQLVNHLQQALKAEFLFHRDQQYVVMDGEVKIVDEFTGRILEGRRYSEGLHQAIEAKENVYVREENQTLATITLQNYFRLYDKLSGMTGTAMTEDAEFREIYNLPVEVIPSNKPNIREDHNDLIYRTIDYKFRAVVNDVVERHAKGQPCLVGTVSIENSERLSRLLNKRGVKHNVLNAKFHAREAQIVAQAGREGAVTIATNMAGRGTDILLGGNPSFLAYDELSKLEVNLDEVTPELLSSAYKDIRRAKEEGRELKGIGELTPDMIFDAMTSAEAICEQEREHVLAAGGLCVIGTERHESRRIDNQLRGRSGRQGDPGETQFYLSLEDDLMRLFGGDRMDRIADMMERWDMPADEPIQNKIVTRSIESAQHKVEEVNFAMRKNVLDYDDVMNKQRQVIYEERNNILDGKDMVERIGEITTDTVQTRVAEFCPEGVAKDQWDLNGLKNWLRELTGKKEFPDLEACATVGELCEVVDTFVDECYQQKAERLGAEGMHALTTQVMLSVIDSRWMSYLQDMDYLKTGIGLRGYGQRDPLVEYKTEAYAAFTELVETMYEDFLRTILRVELIVSPAPEEQAEPTDDGLAGASYSGPAEVDGDQGRGPAPARIKGGMGSVGPRAPQANADKARTYRKSEDSDPYANVGRNDPCPCGSGKKFKNCHGKRH